MWRISLPTLQRQVDRVLYSLIRVESSEQAHHLFYSIEANEIEFGDAAAQFSIGPESKTQGIVGPVDLTTPHPEIAARLRTAKPRQLFPPFKADQWHVLIRLEYRFDSEYDEKTRQFLGSLVLSAKAQDMTKQIKMNYIKQYLAERIMKEITSNLALSSWQTQLEAKLSGFQQGQGHSFIRKINHPINTYCFYQARYASLIPIERSEALRQEHSIALKSLGLSNFFPQKHLSKSDARQNAISSC